MKHLSLVDAAEPTPANAIIDVVRARLDLMKRPGHAPEDHDRLIGGELIVEAHRLMDAASLTSGADRELFLIDACVRLVFELERGYRAAAQLGREATP